MKNKEMLLDGKYFTYFLFLRIKRGGAAIKMYIIGAIKIETFLPGSFAVHFIKHGKTFIIFQT